MVDLGLRIAAVVAEEELVEVSAASGHVERVEVGRDVQQRPDGPGDRQHDAPVGALQDPDPVQGREYAGVNVSREPELDGARGGPAQALDGVGDDDAAVFDLSLI